MKTFWLICALGAVLAPLPARPDDATALKNALSAAYDRECEALTRADAEAWAKVHTPDYVGVRPDGTQDNLDAAIKHTRGLFAVARLTDCSTSLASATQSDSDAAAVVTTTINGTASGAMGNGPLNIVVHSTDTWTQRNGTWLQRGAHVSEQIVSVNGRVIQHDVIPSASPRP